MTREDAVAGIAATVTVQGLKCTAVLDGAQYPDGVKISDQRMTYLEDRILERGSFHGEWNYAFRPVPRPATQPEPDPGPGRAGRCPQASLNHPALTGMDPADIQALAAALQIPFAAGREHESYLRRAARRGTGTRTGPVPGDRSRIDLTGHLLAWRLREHLHLTTDLAAALLGVDRTTISHATSLTRQLLTARGTPLPPAAPPPGTRLRTPDDLSDYAAAAGITLTIPEPGPKTPKYSRRRRTEPRTPT